MTDWQIRKVNDLEGEPTSRWMEKTWQQIDALLQDGHVLEFENDEEMKRFDHALAQ